MSYKAGSGKKLLFFLFIFFLFFVKNFFLFKRNFSWNFCFFFFLFETTRWEGRSFFFFLSKNFFLYESFSSKIFLPNPGVKFELFREKKMKAKFSKSVFSKNRLLCPKVENKLQKTVYRDQTDWSINKNHTTSDINFSNFFLFMIRRFLCWIFWQDVFRRRQQTKPS